MQREYITKKRFVTTSNHHRIEATTPKRVKPSTPSRAKLKALGYNSNQIEAILRQWT